MVASNERKRPARRQRKRTPAKESERERAAEWRARYGSQGGYGASSSYGAYGGSYGAGGYGGHGGSGGFGGESGTAGYGARGTGSDGGSAGRVGDLTTPDTRPGQPGEGRGWAPPERAVRPEERIRAVVRKRLRDAADFDATAVEVAVEDGVVTLTGTVARREDKERITSIVEGVRGVEEIRNELRTKRRTAPVTADVPRTRAASGTPSGRDRRRGATRRTKSSSRRARG